MKFFFFLNFFFYIFLFFFKANYSVGQTMVHLLFRLNEIRDSKVVHLNFLSHELENFIKTLKENNDI